MVYKKFLGEPPEELTLDKEALEAGYTIEQLAQPIFSGCLDSVKRPKQAQRIKRGVLCEFEANESWRR